MSVGILGAQLFGAISLSALSRGSSSVRGADSASSNHSAKRSDGVSASRTSASGGASGASASAASAAKGTQGAEHTGADQKMQGAGQTENGRFDRNECESCQTRKYQDGSNDPGVSFKSPTTISADNSASAVMGHEQEHVSRERSKAQLEGREVISQSVTLQLGVCGECGRSYIAGGETRTVTGVREKKTPYDVGKSDGQQQGNRLDAVA